MRALKQESREELKKKLVKQERVILRAEAAIKRINFKLEHLDNTDLFEKKEQKKPAKPKKPDSEKSLLDDIC